MPPASETLLQPGWCETTRAVNGTNLHVVEGDVLPRMAGWRPVSATHRTAPHTCAMAQEDPA